MRDGTEAALPLVFARGAYVELLDFPPPVGGIRVAQGTARPEADRQQPRSWAWDARVISGVFEIRLSHDGNEYRVMYVPGLARTVYVRHCFQKKRQSTPRQALALTAQRYKEILRLIHA